MNNIEHIKATAARLNPHERRELFRLWLRSSEFRRIRFDLLLEDIARLPRKKRLTGMALR